MKKSYKKLNNDNCKDQIWGLAEDKWTEAQKTQNNEFVESGLGKLGQNELDHK